MLNIVGIPRTTSLRERLIYIYNIMENILYCVNYIRH
jgi:hypothetical protein